MVAMRRFRAHVARRAEHLRDLVNRSAEKSSGKFGRLPGAWVLLSIISATMVPAKIFGGNQITFIHRFPENGRGESR
jgi:hypothetical protein